MSVLEDPSASRYVKLNKEHEQPVEEIRPGELNQPVHVPQVLKIQRSSFENGNSFIGERNYVKRVFF